MVAIRSANDVKENTEEAILAATTEMLEAVIEANDLKDEEMIAIFFSATKDLDAVYPAVAARKMGITAASLMCSQEMYVEGSLPMCVRLLVHVDRDMAQKDVKHMYLGKAAGLRPDLMMKAIKEKEKANE